MAKSKTGDIVQKILWRYYIGMQSLKITNKSSECFFTILRAWPKHHLVHLKYTQFLFVSYTSVKLGENKSLTALSAKDRAVSE